jgi:hypothetical protein
MRLPLLGSMLLLGALATPAGAQYPAEVAAGVRVRLRLPDSVRQAPLQPRRQLLLGTVTHIGGDTLYVAVPGTTGALAVPKGSLHELSVSRGVPSRPESALRHGVELALGGALALWIAHQADDDDDRFDSGGEAAAVGAGIGFGIGALLGALSPSERWRRIRLRE